MIVVREGSVANDVCFVLVSGKLPSLAIKPCLWNKRGSAALRHRAHYSISRIKPKLNHEIFIYHLFSPVFRSDHFYLRFESSEACDG
jgi:hypothetical protein